MAASENGRLAKAKCAKLRSGVGLGRVCSQRPMGRGGLRARVRNGGCCGLRALGVVEEINMGD